MILFKNKSLSEIRSLISTLTLTKFCLKQDGCMNFLSKISRWPVFVRYSDVSFPKIFLNWQKKKRNSRLGYTGTFALLNSVDITINGQCSVRTGLHPLFFKQALLIFFSFSVDQSSLQGQARRLRRYYIKFIDRSRILKKGVSFSRRWRCSGIIIIENGALA